MRPILKCLMLYILPGVMCALLNASVVFEIESPYIILNTYQKTLNICGNVDLETLVKLEKDFSTPLRGLYITDCTSLDDKSLSILSTTKMYSRVEDVRITRSPYISVNGLAAFVHVNELEISMFTELFPFSAAIFPKLRTLRLIYCEKLTDQWLRVFLHKHNKLSCLSVYDCSAITDESLSAISSLIHLECLDLSSCKNLTLPAVLEMEAKLIMTHQSRNLMIMKPSYLY